MKRWIIPVVILAGVALVGGAGYFGYRSAQPAAQAVVQAPPTVAVDRGEVAQSVTAPGQLVSAREQILSLNVGGRVASMNVHPGDHVKTGDVLVELDQASLQYALRSAQATLARAQAELNKLQKPAAAASVAAARAQVTSAQAAYDAASAKYAHIDDQATVAKATLDKAGLALDKAQADLDQAVLDHQTDLTALRVAVRQATIDRDAALANFDLAQVDINDSTVKAAAQALAQAEASLATLTAPPAAEDVAIAQAAVDAAQVTVNQAQGDLNQAKLLAPFDGVVQDVKVKAGDTTVAGSALIQLSDVKALQARSTITEQDYPLARVGQLARLFFDSQPGLIVTGTVSGIVPLRDSGSSSPVYPVYITLDQVPDGLAPGMTVDGSVLIEQRSNVLRLPRALVHARADGSATVKVWANSQMRDRTIQVGLRGDQQVEILSGLSEGELVVSR